MQAHARRARDRAIVYLLLSTGLRREEVIRLDLEQVEPHAPEALRTARKAKITRVKGKGKTERTVFLSTDVRNALPITWNESGAVMQQMRKRRSF